MNAAPLARAGCRLQRVLEIGQAPGQRLKAGSWAVLASQVIRPRIILAPHWAQRQPGPKLLITPGDLGDLEQLLFHHLRKAGLAAPGQALAPGPGLN